jgi:hypothetical protein
MLAGIEDLLNGLLAILHAEKPTWKLLFDKLGNFFEEKFGPRWKEKDKRCRSE